jgi:hypothetical protein
MYRGENGSPIAGEFAWHWLIDAMARASDTGQKQVP